MTYLGAFRPIPAPRSDDYKKSVKDVIDTFNGDTCVIRYYRNHLFDNRKGSGRNEENINGKLIDIIPEHILRMKVSFKYIDSGVLFIEMY